MDLNKKAIEQLDKEYVTGYGVLDYHSVSPDRRPRESTSKGKHRYKQHDVSTISAPASKYYNNSMSIVA